jgi:NADH-quinone oxidoreductase subunit D
LLSRNRIWTRRLSGVGVVSKETALDLGFSGVLLRASGVLWDIRREFPYEVYAQLKFDVPISGLGDSFSRYLIRVYEMYQSVEIITQCLQKISTGPVNFKDSKTSCLSLDQSNTSMEALIQHFKFYGLGFEVPAGSVYSSVEAPKGEFGVFLIVSGGSFSTRCKIKTPGLLHLNGINHMVAGHLLADAVTCIGSIDVVFGEIDR